MQKKFGSWLVIVGVWLSVTGLPVAQAADVFCAGSTLRIDAAGQVWANEVQLDNSMVNVQDVELLPSGELKVIVNNYLMVSDANMVLPGQPSYFRMIFDAYQVVAADAAFDDTGQIMNWFFVPLDMPTFILMYGLDYPLYSSTSPIVDFDIVFVRPAHEWRLYVLDDLGVLSTFSLEMLTIPEVYYVGFQTVHELSLESDVKELTYVDETGNWVQLDRGHPLYDGSQIHQTSITTYWQANAQGFAYDPAWPVIYVSHNFEVVRFWPGDRDFDYIQINLIRLLEVEGLLPASGCVRPGYFWNTQLA